LECCWQVYILIGATIRAAYLRTRMEAQRNGIYYLLDEFPLTITIIDTDGTILWVNKSWTLFGEQNGLAPSYSALGDNYLEITDAARVQSAQTVSRGIRSLLDETRTDNTFTTEYPCHSPNRSRWFRLCAVASQIDGQSCVLIAHQEITKDKITDTLPKEQQEQITSLLRVLSDGARIDKTKSEHITFDLPDGIRQSQSSERTELPAIHEQAYGRLLTYQIQLDESVEEAIISAFYTLGFEVMSEQTVLEEWVDVDALDRLLAGPTPARATVRIWDHPVVVTPETVTIYSLTPTGR